MLAALLASALGFAICAFALFALSLLAAVEPLFVAALLFDSTRPFFFQWLGSIVNYVILVAFALLVTVFIANAADAFIDAITQRSEEHTSELQSLMRTSYAVFCLQKKTKTTLYSLKTH